MKKNQRSIDGFILRRNPEDSGEERKSVYLDSKRFSDSPRTIDAKAEGRTNQHHAEQPLTSDAARKVINDQDVTKDEIESSLTDLPELDKTTEVSEKKSHTRKARRHDKKLAKKSKHGKHKIRRRVIKIISIVVALGVLLAIGLFVWKAFDNLSKAFDGNPLDLFSTSTPLDMDDNGRTNILLLGTSDDEEGHEGSYLTDSIMIISLDQNNYDAYMISIPRDLWVEYGKACAAGYEGKINVIYSCNGGVSGNVEEDRAALKATMPFFEDITGVDLQYAANVNYTVFRDLVNAVGGSITVDIESRNSRGILDSNFDWKCGSTRAEKLSNCPPDGHFLQLPYGVQEIDAEHALYLALARGVGAPTYGLEESNFDREKNQQLVIKGIMDKANSVGLTADPTKIMSLVDSMGDNLRTTFETSQVKTLIKVAENMNSTSLKTISLFDADPSLLTTTTINGQSAVVPTAGTYSYSDIQAYLRRKLEADPAASEEAVIYVYNGGGASGAAATATEKLTDKDFNATVVGNAENSITDEYVIYDLSNGEKSGTSAALARMFGVEVKKVTVDELPGGLRSDGDFIVIVGPSLTDTETE